MNRRNFLGALSGTGALLISPFGVAAAAPPAGSTRPFASPRPIPRFGDGRDWFFEKRYGMFVHWGLYSINGWHEQDQWRRRIPRAEYVKLAKQWNPVKFNPDAWLDLMQEGGMQYLCITTKHHDGFCLWDTKLTPFNTVNTPYGKDLIKLLADACHRRKVPLCLYYSIADWNQPNYPSQGRHHELPAQPGDQPDWDKYLEFLRGQVRELCTNYGELHGFWWDMNVPKHRDPSINAMIRKLQPKAVINNRGFDDGDFGTPERDYDKDDARAFEKPVEACQSVGRQSWGYRTNEDYYSDRHLIRSIDRYLARDANYLLNVGPRPDGTIPDEAAGIVRRIGQWHHQVRESFTNVRPLPGFISAAGLLITARENVLYVHLNEDPVVDAVQLAPLATKPRRAVLLNTGAPLECTVEMLPTNHERQESFLNVRGLPINQACNSVLVAKLEFDKPVESLRKDWRPADAQSLQVR